METRGWSGSKDNLKHYKKMAKKQYDKALYRLTTIVSRLLMGEALDVKVNVSVRTIYG